MQDTDPDLLIDLIAHADFSGIVWQVTAIVLIMLLAYLLDKLILKRLTAKPNPQNIALSGVKSIVFPVFSLIGIWLVRTVFKHFNAPVSLLKLVIPLFLSLFFTPLLICVYC